MIRTEHNRIIYNIWHALCIIKDRYCIPIIRNYRITDSIYLYVQAFFRGEKLREYDVLSVTEFAKDNNVEIIEIEKETVRPVYIPEFFGRSKANIEYYNSPNIYIAKLYDVDVIGGTGILRHKQIVLFDYLAGDNDNRLDLHFYPLRRNDGHKLLMVDGNVSGEIDKAINLLGFGSTNYYHFTIEILSRLAYIDQYEEYRDLPILVDEEITKYDQLREMLIMANIHNHSIKYIGFGQYYHVNEIIMPSMNTWMPLNVRDRTLFRVDDNLIAESAVRNIHAFTGSKKKKQTDKKIFISRVNTKNSRIQNEKEIATLFKARGYDIVCTEEMSYIDQIELFSEAKCVVGSSGAALTNILYCHEGTMIGCIIPEMYHFYIYSSLAYLCGCNCLFLDASIAGETKYISSDRIVVDIEKCKEYISEIEKRL